MKNKNKTGPTSEVLRPVSPDKTTEDCKKCQEYIEGWKRAQADYANLQKSTGKERDQLRKYAYEDILQVILPAIDQYDVALKHTPDFEAFSENHQKLLKNWLIGLHAVRGIWEQTFEAIGLVKVREEGEFDPQIHEAIKEDESEKIKSGNIISVQQSGWMLKDKLLRPARVIVAK